jgi:DNA-directed RNA polymerase specialized sigma24 family protein
MQKKNHPDFTLIDDANSAFLDNSLISGLNQGNDQAFATLVKKYCRWIVNTCFGFVRHEQEAEDVAQEVFLEVFRNWRIRPIMKELPNLKPVW